jgi:hypothetical protein
MGKYKPRILIEQNRYSNVISRMKKRGLTGIPILSQARAIHKQLDAKSVPSYARKW